MYLFDYKIIKALSRVKILWPTATCQTPALQFSLYQLSAFYFHFFSLLKQSKVLQLLKCFSLQLKANRFTKLVLLTSVHIQVK